jgi:hypothetical protein
MAPMQICVKCMSFSRQLAAKFYAAMSLRPARCRRFGSITMPNLMHRNQLRRGPSGCASFAGALRSDPDTMAIIRERVRQIRAVEATFQGFRIPFGFSLVLWLSPSGNSQLHDVLRFR